MGLRMILRDPGEEPEEEEKKKEWQKKNDMNIFKREVLGKVRSRRPISSSPLSGKNWDLSVRHP